MAPLPILYRAACGHYVPKTTKPSGQEPTGAPIVLCPTCRQALIAQRVEKKA
jgi:hypothetical protein